MDVELFQFRFSNAAEKVRWALEHKRIAHRRRDLLPGLHRTTIKRLTRQTATPVLCIAGERIAGSAAIIAALEQRFPGTPPLYPDDPDVRGEALELARHFDHILGPAVRIVVLTAALDDARYAARLFAAGARPATRAAYRALLPFLRPQMRRAAGIHYRHATQLAERHLHESAVALARLAKRSRYLCGDRFGIADLTAASLFAPLVCAQPDMRAPEPMPDALAGLVAKWRAHPVGQWTLEMYRCHRPWVSPS